MLGYNIFDALVHFPLEAEVCSIDGLPFQLKFSFANSIQFDIS